MIGSTQLSVHQIYYKLKASTLNLLLYQDKNNNIQSKHFDNFDHKVFCDTMRLWVKDNFFFISEYTAPQDFEEVWSKSMGSLFHAKKKRNVEKIFMYKYGL